MWCGYSKWKKRWAFSANIGFFDDRAKNTFWGKSKYSNFVGWVIQLFIIETFQTVLTFLSPISCPITKFSTVCETKHRSIHLSKISNMKYTILRLMWVQQRNNIKLSVLIQMNSRTSFYISGIFMISCIFLVTVKNFLVTVGLKRFYITQECVQWVE